MLHLWPCTSFKVPLEYSIRKRRPHPKGIITKDKPNAGTNKAIYQTLSVNDSGSNSSGPTTTAGTTSRPALTGVRSGQRVLGKGACKCLLASHLLTADEALNRDSDSAVNVGRCHIVTEAHATESFADTDDSLQMTDLRG